jgi:Tat protein secretion system quality control protein TatD with DNase activity
MCQSADSELDSSLTNHGVPVSKEEFDPSLFQYLADGHCHPHDDLEHLSRIPQLQTGHVTIMGVRQDDWDTVTTVAEECNKIGDKKCIPCYGIHPWFCHRLMSKEESEISAEEHYRAILKSPKQDELDDMVKALEPPFPFREWYGHLRLRLIDNPDALVGEVGLDKAARLLPGGVIDWHGVKPTTVQCSIEHQKKMLEIQINLAKELNRGASIHCVQAQGHLFEVLNEHAKKIVSKRKQKILFNEPAPESPIRVCLHSYGGSPATIPQFLQLKGFTVFVSFSVAINARLTPNKLADLIRAVPEDRLIIESDLNTSQGLDTAIVEMARIVAEARSWSLEKVVKTTYKNWQRFVDNNSADS